MRVYTEQQITNILAELAYISAYISKELDKEVFNNPCGKELTRAVIKITNTIIEGEVIKLRLGESS